MAHSIEEALTLAERIGFPVIVRPSFVIGGLAIDFCYSTEDLERQLALATVVDPDRPVRIDRYLEGVEVDVDTISDGERVLMRIARACRAGGHALRRQRRRRTAVRQRGRPGPHRRDDGTGRARPRREGSSTPSSSCATTACIVEVNPRASRTVPFMSRVTGVRWSSWPSDRARGDAPGSRLGWRPADPAVRGRQGAAFSTAKLRGVDPSVGPACSRPAR